MLLMTAMFFAACSSHVASSSSLAVGLSKNVAAHATELADSADLGFARAASGVPVGNPPQTANRQILAGSPLRVDAIIEAGGRHWVRRQWLQTGDSDVTDLPWHAMRIEPPRVMRGKRRESDG